MILGCFLFVDGLFITWAERTSKFKVAKALIFDVCLHNLCINFVCFLMLFSALASKGGTQNQSTELHILQNNVRKEAWRSYPERLGADQCVIWRCTPHVARATSHVACCTSHFGWILNDFGMFFIRWRTFYNRSRMNKHVQGCQSFDFRCLFTYFVH